MDDRTVAILYGPLGKDELLMLARAIDDGSQYEVDIDCDCIAIVKKDKP